MLQQTPSTLERIHSAALAEFLEKGYTGASLRQIVRAAGVTTGALYGYYDSKASLFAALVDEPYRYILDGYRAVVAAFEALPPAAQAGQIGRGARQYMQQLLDYIGAHRPAFQLLLTRAEGTRYARLPDEIAALAAQAAEHYYTALRALGQSVPALDPRLGHMLMTGMVNTFCDIALHDTSPAEARRDVDVLSDFYTAGWLKILGQ